MNGQSFLPAVGDVHVRVERLAMGVGVESLMWQTQGGLC